MDKNDVSLKVCLIGSTNKHCNTRSQSEHTEGISFKVSTQFIIVTVYKKNIRLFYETSLDFDVNGFNIVSILYGDL